MFCFKPSIGLILLSLVLFAALPAGGHAAASSPRLQEVTPPNLSLQQLAGQSPELQIVLRDFKAEAVAKGSIRVAVKLPVAFAPETRLRNAEKQQQRADIEAAVRALRASLPLARNLEAVPGLPYVRLTLDHAGLTRLETIPGLTRVTRAEEMNWLRDFVELYARESTAGETVPREEPADLLVVRPQVAGGRNAGPDVHPFQVSLVMVRPWGRDDFSGHFCGGSLIAERFVVTAAHCVVDIDPSGFRVVVGTRRLDNTGRLVNVARRFIHPEYSRPASSRRVDVAVLELAEPVTGVPFAILATTQPTTPGTMLRFTGWGKFDYWDAELIRPVDLQEIDLPYVPTVNGICGSYQAIRLHEICAGGVRGEGVCNADLGGPLTIERGTGHVELVGIANRTAKCGLENMPGAFASVAYVSVNSFIRSIAFPPLGKIGFTATSVSVNERPECSSATVIGRMAEAPECGPQ